MDVLAHTLWTNAAFYKKYATNRKQRYIAAFFGVSPDLVGFTPAFIYLLFSGNRFSPALFESGTWVFRYAQAAYNYSHSLVVFAAVFLLVFLLRKGKPYWPLLGWALHIALDIPTHKGFYETPFLYPLSDYRFSNGTTWGHPVFMAVNYGALMFTYMYILFFYRKKHEAKT